MFCQSVTVAEIKIPSHVVKLILLVLTI
jgi:hypothetical protein